MPGTSSNALPIFQVPFLFPLRPETRMSTPDATASPPSSLLSSLVHYYEELVDYVRWRFGDRGFAREIVHDVCVQLMERPEREVVHTPLALLRRISHDTAVDRCRADDARRAWIDSVDVLPDVACGAPDAMRILSAEQELALLAEAIASLPLRRRQVFVMHKIHGLAQADVAARLGVSLKMVEKQMRLALLACRARLDREAGVRRAGG